MVLGIPSGGNLLFEFEQVQVTRHMRTETGHFHVVPQDVRIPGNIVRFAREEPFLVVEARPPCQTATHLEVFSHGVPQHVRGMDPFRGILVVQAPRRMDVVVSGPPTPFRRIDPAFDLVLDRHGLVFDGEPFAFGNRFGTVRTIEGVVSRRESDRFPVATIDLLVEEEIGGEAFGLSGIDASRRVANHESRHRRRSVDLVDAERHRNGGA